MCRKALSELHPYTGFNLDGNNYDLTETVGDDDSTNFVSISTKET